MPSHFLNADSILLVCCHKPYSAKKESYTVIYLLMHFIKRGYYSLKCCYEVNHDVSFEHEEFNMCKGKGMH